MAKSKMDRKVVVNQAYFELILRKANLIDDMSSRGDGSISVDISDLKELERIERAWDRLNAGLYSDTEPYKEPPQK